MRALLAPLEELGEYEEIKKMLVSKQACVALSGCVDSQKLHMVYGIGDGFRNKIIVTFNDLRAKELYEDYKFYDRNVMLYPAKDLIFFQADIHGNQLTMERIRCLRRLMEGRPTTVITTYDALMAPQIPMESWRQHVIRIDRQSVLAEEELATQLVELGYEKNYQVEAPGQFSIRGGIVDIFDLTEENPYRIELWGEDVESIRSFDILSQRSIEKLESVTIFPATELILTDEELRSGLKKIETECRAHADRLRKEMKTEEAHRIETQIRELEEQLLELGLSRGAVNLESYVHYFYPALSDFLDCIDNFSAGMAGRGGSCVFVEEPLRVKEHAAAVELEFRESMMHRLEKGYILPGQMNILYSAEETAARIARGRVVTLSMMDGKNPLFKADRKFDIQTRSLSSYNNSFEALVRDLAGYKKKGYRILLLSGSRTRAKRLAEDLREQEISAFYTEDPMREVQPGEVMTYYGRVLKGFEYPLLKFIVISESDIFGAEKKKKKKKKVYQGQKINDFNELRVGDYVVHESHGLGVYQGIEKVEVDKIVKDYMKISYRDGGILYVLATGLDVIQKYASAEAGTKPKLNKLGTQEWNKTKSKVRSAVDEIAQDLVELYATRQQSEGFQYGKDTVWQREFEEMFPFEETEDQISAIMATKEDMESSRIMDRLICGDVGYGKTEIAIRAAFKAVQENKQVVYLVPTTILAQQHYNTFVQRMKDFPVRIDLLSRFRTAAEQKKTITDLKKGMVDIVIGTHRVLSADVEYKDLGLLIIDEEQRFGVAHKEKIKKLKENVDVLTLTATPIPRTLAIILYGDLDISVISELPKNRLPIKNCVVGTAFRKKAYEFIAKEVHGGNQAYVICPMVDAGEEGTQELENVTDYGQRLRSCLPEDIHVEILHGKMKPADKKRVMDAFAAGDVHVLVATTVIEVGINVPAATVMMIENAERFGLAQLHQLRGRIGRGNQQSYCIFINGSGKESSMERLQVLNKSNDGFSIAEEDLKLRGPGDLFGFRQSGAMEFRIADIYQDSDMLKKISVTVDRLLAKDKELSQAGHAMLKRYLEENAGNFIDFRTI